MREIEIPTYVIDGIGNFVASRERESVLGGIGARIFLCLLCLVSFSRLQSGRFLKRGPPAPSRLPPMLRLGGGCSVWRKWSVREVVNLRSGRFSWGICKVAGSCGESAEWSVLGARPPGAFAPAPPCYAWGADVRVNRCGRFAVGRSGKTIARATI